MIYSQYDPVEMCSKSKIREFTNPSEFIILGNQSDFDIKYCKLSIEIFPSASSIAASNELNIKILKSNTNYVDLDLTNSLNVSSVKISNQNVYFEHSSDLLHINLDRNYALNEDLNIIVNYNGKPGSNFHFDTRNGEPMVWTLSEPYGSKDWWPCKNLPDDKLDSINIFVTLPSNLKVASNGLLLSVDTLGSNKLKYHWTERYPIATYLVSLAIHPYIIDADYFRYSENDSMRIENYIAPDAYASNSEKYKIIDEMLHTFSDLYGLYPFIDEKYGHAEFPWNGGMEHQTITSCLGPYEGLLVHELGHQWWGDMITCKDFHHIWLNEGFATYTEALWEEHKNGLTGLKSSMAGKKYLGKGTVYCDNIEDSGRIFNGNLSYNKGAWVLHMLRHVVGDEDFFKIYKAWGKSSKRFGVAVTEDFKNICENVANTDLDYFFNQWIYGDFHPIYLYDWSFKENGNYFDVELSLEQFQVDRIYKMPIDITIVTQNGNQVFTILNDKKFEKYSFTLNSKPIDLIIDEDDWILKEAKKGINLLNHDNNNLILTMGTTGCLGYDKPDGLGNGLIIKSLDENILYFGTFMFGNSTNYVVDNPEKSSDVDFQKSLNNNISFIGDNGSEQNFIFIYNDAGHPDNKGIKIVQSSISKSENPDKNWIIISYKLINDSNEAINDLTAGVFADFDIGDYLNNIIAKDQASSLIYQFNDNLYAGIKLLNKSFNKVTFVGIKDAIDKFGENVKYDYLTGVKNDIVVNTKSDWSSLLSAGKFNLLQNDSIEISFAIITGNSLQSLKENAQSAQNYFDKYIVLANDFVIENNEFDIYPNPANNQFIVSSNESRII